MFDVTDACNFRCKHCYKAHPDICKDLEINIIERFLKDVESNGFVPSIVISGGEPLMYKNIFKLLDLVCDGRSVRINTNGILLDKYYERLKKYNNIRIQVSLDGYDDETFFEVRNNHSFAKIVNNTVRAYEAGLDIYFRSTLTGVTFANYEKFIEVSKSTGVPLVIRPMYNTGEISQQQLRIEFEDLCIWQKDVIEKNYLEYVGCKDLITESSCPLLNRDTIFSVLTVDNYGRIFPCQMLRGNKFYMGSIYRDSFKSIFLNAEKIVKELEKIIHNDSCERCGFRKQFGNGTCVPACYLGNKKCVKEKIYGVRK